MSWSALSISLVFLGTDVTSCCSDYHNKSSNLFPPLHRLTWNNWISCLLYFSIRLYLYDCSRSSDVYQFDSNGVARAGWVTCTRGGLLLTGFRALLSAAGERRMFFSLVAGGPELWYTCLSESCFTLFWSQTNKPSAQIWLAAWMKLHDDECYNTETAGVGYSCAHSRVVCCVSVVMDPASLCSVHHRQRLAPSETSETILFSYWSASVSTELEDPVTTPATALCRGEIFYFWVQVVKVSAYE